MSSHLAAATAFLFPGQGSQRVGMGRDLVAEHPWLLEHYYHVADRVLGLPLTRWCFEGPQDTLLQTEVTQPAVFLTSVATLGVLREHGIEPDVVAGHSLGEYAALVAAGVLDWPDALRLVRRRGELMASATEKSGGAMAAVLGLSSERVQQLCHSAQARCGEPVEIANDNDPSQLVVSGTVDAVAGVAELARAAGAERVVQLDVSAAFHSSLMRPVEDAFSVELDGIPFHDPTVPVVANVTAERVQTAEQVKDGLRRQLVGTVRWTETLRQLGSRVGRFVEVGPGRVLTGFCRTTLPDVPVHATGDNRRLRQTLRVLAQPSQDAEGLAGDQPARRVA